MRIKYTLLALVGAIVVFLILTMPEEIMHVPALPYVLAIAGPFSFFYGAARIVPRGTNRGKRIR